MPKLVILEEFHLTVLVPKEIRGHEVGEVRRTLRAVRFQRTLRAAIRGLIRGNPNLRLVRFKLSW
jgi:hypothetical protein